MNEVIIMEISAKEAQMIMNERMKAEKQMKREMYVAEFNDLIERAKADGFIIAANHPFKTCENLQYAKCWTDHAGTYIGLC